MDPLRLPRKVGIERANHDAKVLRCELVEPDEMLSIHGEQDTPFGDGEGEHLFVGNGKVGPARISAGQHIVTKHSEVFGDRIRKVLVRVYSCHKLCRLVLGDLRLDLVAMGAVVRPGVHQILGVQRRIRAQQFCLARPEASRLDQ